MTLESLMIEMVRCGMIQFGHFTASYGQAASPVKFHFTRLPSFPMLMSSVADLFVEKLKRPLPDMRLLATSDTIGLSSVLATKTGIPLLYPRLNTSELMFIEGTADVEQPIVMIIDVLDDGQRELALHQLSKRIGLPVMRCIALLDTNRQRVDGFEETFEIVSLFELATVINWIETAGIIPETMATRLRGWQKEALSP